MMGYMALFISIVSLCLVVGYIHYDVKQQEEKDKALKTFQENVFKLINGNRCVEDINDGED